MTKSKFYLMYVFISSFNLVPNYVKISLTLRFIEKRNVSGIVNAGNLPLYDDISSELLELCEDVLWNRRPDSTERLLTYAENHSTDSSLISHTKDMLWREWSVEERIKHSLFKVKMSRILIWLRWVNHLSSTTFCSILYS